MTIIWKRRSIVLLIWAVLLLIFSLSGIFNFTFIQMFPILMMGPIGMFTFWFLHEPLPEVDEETQQLLDAIGELEQVKEEQYTVIKEYEELFDLQLVELPCICGGNTFKGLFSPNTPNEVQCEKCKNNYRVEINYDTVLISEPLDQSTNNKTLG